MASLNFQNQSKPCVACRQAFTKKEQWLSLLRSFFANSECLCCREADVSYASGGAGNAHKRSVAKVKASATNVGPAIGNSHCHCPAIVLVHHTQSSTEWQVWVGGDHCIGVHGLSVCHGLPCKAITLPIKRSL